MYKNWAGHNLPGLPPFEIGDTWRVSFSDGEEILAIYTEEGELVDLESGETYSAFDSSWTYELVNIQFLIMED